MAECSQTDTREMCVCVPCCERNILHRKRINKFMRMINDSVNLLTTFNCIIELMSTQYLCHQSRHQAEQHQCEAITILLEFYVHFLNIRNSGLFTIYFFSCCYAPQKNISIKHLENDCDRLM